MKIAKFRILSWPFLIFIMMATFSSIEAAYANRITVAPVRGNAKYPLIMSGLREVLLANLDQSQVFTISDFPLDSQGFSSADLSRLAESDQADTVIILNFREGRPNFTVTVRAYDVQTQYNLGSEEVTGNYKSIRLVQDAIYRATVSLLRTEVPPTTRAEILQGNTSELSALAALGSAEVAYREKKHFEAIKEMSRASTLDPKFKSAIFQTRKKGSILLPKIRDASENSRALAYLGNTEKSLSSFDQILLKDPANTQALIGKAEILLSLGRNDEAEKLFLKASTLDSKNFQIFAGLGEIYQKKGSTDSALRAFEKARDLGSTDPKVYESLGQIYYAKNDKARASAAYQTAGQLSENRVDLRAAQKNLGNANTIAPSLATLLKQADLFLNEADYLIAIDRLSKAVLLNPTSDAIHARLGQAYFLNQQSGQARISLQKAFDLNPANFEANYFLGRVYLEDPKTQSLGIKHLENAVQIRPNEQEVQYFLAQAYLDGNRANAAVELLENLIKTFPRDANTHHRLAEAYFAAEDFNRSLISFRRAVELDPDLLVAREGVARSLLALGKREEAFEAIDLVYALDAERNLFLQGGGQLLENFVSVGLLQMIRALPKTVDTLVGEVPINQVFVRSLGNHEPEIWKRWLKKLTSLYVINHGRIQSDVELASFAQFRLIPHSKLGNLQSASIERIDFENPNTLSELMVGTGIDGLIGFEPTLHRLREDVAEIRVEPIFLTTPDRNVHRIDTAAIPNLIYPVKEVLSLNVEGLTLWAILLASLLLPTFYITVIRARARGKGNLRVIVNYDPSLESFLTLKLSKTQEKERDSTLVLTRDREKYEKRKFKRMLRQKGAWVRQMVGQNTLFEKVPARLYYCYLYGTIEDKALRKTIGNYYMVQKIEIEKGQTKEITFQLVKDEAFVTVFVTKGDVEITGAVIRVSGQKELVYSRAEQGAFVYLKKGRHKITVSHEDAIAHKIVEVHNFDDMYITIDLAAAAQEDSPSGEGTLELASEASDEGLGAFEEPELGGNAFDRPETTEELTESSDDVYASEVDTEKKAEQLVKEREFSKAAELYHDLGKFDKYNYLMGVHYFQQGDHPQAIQYLEKSDNFAVLSKIYLKMGDEKKSNFYLAKDYLKGEKRLEAAQLFVKAEAWSQAAELFEGIGDLSKAAVLYAKDGNFPLAGELFAQSGDTRKAAMAFEKAGLLDQALTFYRDLGEPEKLIEIFLKQENFLEAAKINREQGLLDEAISICQKVAEGNPSFVASQALLGQLFFEKGLQDLAIKTLFELTEKYSTEVDAESRYLLGDLLEKSGDFPRSLLIFENLLKDHFNFRDINARTQELKEKVSASKNIASTIASQTPRQDDADSRYEMLGELGRGAMGIVFKARDKMLDRVVAVKTLPHSLKDDQQALESLLREAQTAAKLNHPNIVTVFDVGQENGNYFIAMEYVEGKTLQDILKQIKRVDLTNFKIIARALCDVVSYAHKNKVIHRDIKPSNILLTKNRSIKLMDFGLAKVLQEMSIDKTMLRGTPLYMSPEQVLGKDIDHRTDLYSLGVLFFEMLAGTPPFYQGDIMYAHLHTPPPDLSSLVSEIPTNIANAVMSCLSKSKEERPASADELNQKLNLG